MAKKESKPKIKTLAELRKEVKDTRDLLTDLRLEISQNKVKNLRSLFLKRKDLARMLTSIRKMEMAEERATK